MNDQERKLCARYIPSPKDGSLKWNEYYILDVAGRVQRVTIMGTTPGMEGGSTYFPCDHRGLVRGKWADLDGWVRKCYLYDNQQDCEAGTHDCYDRWEELRGLQQGEEANKRMAEHYSMAEQRKHTPKMVWLTDKPDHWLGGVLLVRRRPMGGGYYVEWGAVCGKDVEWGKDIVAYMVIPHMVEDRRPWKSEYMGDDLPNTSGYYIVCTKCTAGDIPSTKIAISWYDSVRCEFGLSDVLGYMRIPDRYSSRKMMEHT